MAEYYDDLVLEKKRRVRKPTWTDKETRSLVTEFDLRRDVLRPKTENIGTIRTDQRHRAWVEICRAVNLANPLVHRTIPEVQKKWQNLCLTTKRELDMKGTREIQESSDSSFSRNEVESIVIRDMISSNRGTGNAPTVDYVIKVENMEDDDEDGDGEVYTDELLDRYIKTPETTTSSDHEVTQSDNTNYVSGSHDSHTSYSVRPTKRHHSEAFPEFDTYNNDMFHLKKQKILLEIRKFNSECEKLQIEKEKLIVEKEKVAMERDKLALEIQILKSDPARLAKNDSIKSENRDSFRDKKLSANLQNDQFINHSVKEKALLERERIQLENEKLKLELQILRNSQQGGNNS